jgi:lipopolysaccharide export system protein LptA
VNARSIDIQLDKTIIDASGDLTTQTAPDKSASSKGLFDESKPMLGRADTLNYDDAKNQAVYTGRAKLSQGSGKDESYISGDKVTVDSTAGDLSADGGVTARFPIDNLSTTAKDAPAAKAASFSYKDAAHHALYTGTEKDRAQFNSPDLAVRGVTIDMWLSDEGRELKRMLVNRNVEARVSADRTARGEQLDYDVKSGTHVLKGRPARVIQRSMDKGAESCSESRGPAMSFTKTQGDKDQGTFTVSDPVGAGTQSRNLPNCGEWIIK